MHRRPTPHRRPALATALAAALAAALGASGAPAQDRAPASGADAPSGADAAVAATVDGRDVPAMAVDEVARQLEADGAAADRDRILDELVDMEVLAQAAERAGLDATPEIATALRLQRMQTLANAYLADASASIRIGEERLREEYERQAAGLPAREFRASHVLLETEREARDVVAELDAGADFAELAAARSIDPAGASGGDLGWVMAGGVDAGIVEALAALEPGEVAPEPVATDFGFHVLRLDAARDATPPDFAAVRPGLRELVLRRLLAERVEALRADADVELR